IWNAAIILSLIIFGQKVGQTDLAVIVCWGSVLGSGLQFAIQLPSVFSLVDGLRLKLELTNHVREVIKNFTPVVVGRGVVQVSAYVDNLLATLLPDGAVSALSYAQIIYLLPVSLFGMSVSAAELPVMSSAIGSSEEIAKFLKEKLEAGLQRIAFYVVPSAVGFLALGDVISSALYQSGRFTRDDALYVWAVLAGSAVGLLAATLGRLYSSTFYALKDTRTPLKFALTRVILSIPLGYLLSLELPEIVAIPAIWGTAGISAASGVAAWIEFALLRQSLNKRIGKTGLKFVYIIKLWIVALVAASLAWMIKLLLATIAFKLPPTITAMIILAPYGGVYFVTTAFLKISESEVVFKKIRRIIKR
ncbi:MAG: murein biosynthesis integral membrane protein MurJ, partial [Blastocatellia bacterium]|nr:murein biosynthesis integral membrane protein MurJ [Blastocatellia bacterium]